MTEPLVLRSVTSQLDPEYASGQLGIIGAAMTPRWTDEPGAYIHEQR